ncbi:vitamin K epoxide reductase family protein [Microbacterium sp. R86528]|uniref:vitamin K epoxide reductase family protein n=1 Tax=Microbacterium sp. R86528 TaxID=3093864 RepID=UPI0037CB7651
MPNPSPRTRPTALAVWLVIAGVIGWWAAFQLTIEKFHALTNPGEAASCDFNPLVQCSANLDSWQGSVFGFPNPLMGLTAWAAPIVVGMAILAGARFARWFWLLFELGLTLAFVFVIWLISQSIFVLGTLCPWCMVTWAVTIPTFYAVTLYTLHTGLLPAPASIRRGAGKLTGWVPVLTVLSYAAIAVIAQLRLDVLGALF